MEERLQKLISQAGLASRRRAEEMILAGEVTVNGQVITELGAKADIGRDHVKVRGKLINPKLANREKVYVLVNKPRGYLCAVSDPEDRLVVSNLLPPKLSGLFPVGRLDVQSEGLLLLTNDGEMANAILSAGPHCPKKYHVRVKGSPSEEGLARIRKGMTLDGERMEVASVKEIKKSEAGNIWYDIVLHQGRNQQIRRMFEAIGHSVVKLRRVAIGHVTDRGLKVGEFRSLTTVEVEGFRRLQQLKRKGSI